MKTDAKYGWRMSEANSLSLDQPRLMGILNVTPDSFFDGGMYADAHAAFDAALRMKAEGAAVIDIGGESTRPGAQPIGVREQIARTVPVIQAIRKTIDAENLLISIDTTRSEVARAALDAGADILNDVSAGRDDEDMLPLAASRVCGIILMHRLAAPQHDSYSTQYTQPPQYEGGVFPNVRDFLAERCQAAIRFGVQQSSIVIDPGLGFGKTVAQNYALAGKMRELAGELKFPVLSAASRKSFLGAVSGAKSPDDRLAGSLALTIAHWQMGVRLFRVHDVAAHRQALQVAQTIDAAGVSGG